MSIPKLKKIKSEKKYHDLTLSDEYAWVDQPNILEVLKDASKLDSEVKDYISGNNKITEDYFKDVKDLQKNLFQEIKSKIKLDDTSLKFKDKKYFYWAKTEAKGNYGKRIRQLIDGSKPEEVYFDGDLEKKNYGSEYFGVGSVSTSHCDNYMAYSLDLKGSEYYTIYLRDLRTGKNENDIIDNTSGGITWSLDNRSFFYSKLDKFHRPRQIFKHVLGTPIKEDKLIFDEKDDIIAFSPVKIPLLSFTNEVNLENLIQIGAIKKILNYNVGVNYPRLLIWKSTLSFIFEKPIFGWGAGTFTNVFTNKGHVIIPYLN